MNDNALRAIQAGELCDYIDGQRIEYIADNQQAIEFFFDADRSCGDHSWRTRWRTVHHVWWPPDGRTDSLEYVVLRRDREN